MPYYLGYDVSTTATKALLIDENGTVQSVSAAEYSFETPHPLWSEQDPELWWRGAIHSTQEVLAASGVSPHEIRGIGLTGQMHGLVLLDENGAVLRPAILWNDQRTGAECDAIRERIGKSELVQITGNDALTGFTAPKVLWVRAHEPDVYKRAAFLLLPKDFVRYRMTGLAATDRAGAAGTLLLDIRKRDWSEDIVKALDIPRAWLPPTHEGPDITGLLSEDAAQALGLTPGIPVVAGGGDQAAQAVGVGAVEEGIVALTLGTSGVVFATAARPFIEPEGKLHAFCHAVPGRWHLMGVMLSAAGSLRWYRDTVAPGTSFDDLLGPAASVAAGADGLLFLPYLTGERTPHPDPLARGAFVGLTVRHTTGHLTRSVLEGVAFGLRDSFSLMQEAGLPAPRQVRVSGGGSRSPLWRQILSDVLQTELVTVNTSEGAAYGAALLAAVGTGRWASVDAACSATVAVTGRTSPDPAKAPAYEAAYRSYRALYPALKPTFEALGSDSPPA